MYNVIDERKKGMMLMNENHGDVMHVCIYVMCIEILLRYVMLARMHTFDIYVHHDIMQIFHFMSRPRDV